MADDDEPEDGLLLNTLDRFRKQSPRLLLEEYSHCEVPAGCGGVVLRWVDPGAGVPALLRVVVVSDGEATAWIDGVELDSSRTILAPGERVLAIELTDVEAPGILLVELQRNLGRDPTGAARLVVTRTLGNGGWRACPRAQVPGDWTRPEFDADRDWPTLSRTDAEVGDQARNAWQVRQMRAAGTEALALPHDLVHDGVVRLRHRFVVEPLEPEAR